jgi:hypothetical protein
MMPYRTSDNDNYPDDFLGLCPNCFRNNGFLNVHKTHWTVCHEHMVRWSIGTNLFSSWRDETSEIWWQNEQLLSTYWEVEPFFYPRPETPAREQKPEVFSDDYCPF